MSTDEVDEFFDQQRGWLDMIVMLELLAATEGALRIDFDVRVYTRKKDPVSREFREIAKKHANKIQFEQHILETWKKRPHAKKSVSNFKGALRLRNWLTHGRYWRPKLGRDYAPNDVFDIAVDLLDAVDKPS